MRKTTFAILCLEGAVLSFNVAAAAALVPSIAEEFALSQFLVGRIVWLYMIPYGLAALLYGPLVRAFDARKVELTCMLLFSLANLLAGSAWNISSLFTARLFMGLFGASVIPLGLIIISEQVALEKRGSYIGMFFGLTFVASLLGLFLSGILNWRLIFLIPAACGFVLWIAMYLYLPSFKKQGQAFKFNYIHAFKNKDALRIFSYIFLISLVYHAVQQWLGVYFSLQLGLRQIVISMLITLTSLSGIFGEIFGGSLADSFGSRRIVNTGVILMAVCIFAMILKLPLLAIVLVMIIWGLGWTFNHVGLATMLTSLPREMLNEAASLNSAVRFIAGGVGVGLSGLIMKKSFTLGFSVFGCALLLVLFFEAAVLFRNTNGGRI